ncbi:MAG TPA: caspase family protein, partial [Phenylobacterium sp.]
MALTLLGVTLPAVAAEPAPRLALVIANSDYANLPALPNAARDGDTVSAALNTARFVDASGSGPVRPRRNLTAEALRAEIAQFREALARAGPDAFGMVYFSGHGAAFGAGGNGALLPVDQGPKLDAGLVTRASLTDDLLAAGARTVVVVLDMCRSPLDPA